MTARFLGFYFLALLVILTAALMQRMYSPTIEGVDTTAASSALESSSGNIIEQIDDANNLDGEDNKLADEEVDNAASLMQPETEQPISDDSAASDGSADGNIPPAAITSSASESEISDDNADDLFTIGSLAVDSDYRFLITLDRSGGTIRRVELNFRDAKGQHRYRDLEYEGGYLGELDIVSAPDGCLVRSSGHGTPAQQAGIKKGDRIQTFNGEPVFSADDFNKLLSKTRPGQKIELSVNDGQSNSNRQTEIELTDKPIELIRPQPDILGNGWIARPSFRTTLREPSKTEQVWPVFDEDMMDGKWEIDSLESEAIRFKYSFESGDGRNENNDLITVTKSYQVPELQSDDISAFSRDFHFGFDLTIENGGQSDVELAYQLDGPLGTPTETWWYQNKIHGRSSAIMYTAGARDVIASTGQNEFVFFGGPEIVTNLKSTDPDYYWLLPPANQTDSSAQQVRFLSVDTQYFNVALLPVDRESPFTAYSVLADATDVEIPKSAKEQKLVDCTFRLFKTLDLKAGEKYSQSFEVFAGPKEADLLASYGLDEVRSFGWFALFSKPLCWLLKLFHSLTFGLGYGIPIILLTVLVRSLMIPISRKAAINAQMMQYLQPQMKEIADKYKNDMEKRGQAQRDLFRKYNYNPFSGCFMMFFQLPIFIGLYRGLSVDIALRDQPLIPGLGWCSNLAAPDQLWYWKESLPGFMSFLTSETGWLGPYFNILPILTCVLFVVQQKMFTPPPTDEQQELMQKVMKYMMIFMGLLFFKVPSGLCLYFITSAMWSIAERKMLPKPELDTSKLEKIDDDGDAKSTVGKFYKQLNRTEQTKNKRAEAQEERKRQDKERKKKLRQRGG